MLTAAEPVCMLTAANLSGWCSVAVRVQLCTAWDLSTACLDARGSGTQPLRCLQTPTTCPQSVSTKPSCSPLAASHQELPMCCCIFDNSGTQISAAAHTAASLHAGPPPTATRLRPLGAAPVWSSRHLLTAGPQLPACMTATGSDERSSYVISCRLDTPGSQIILYWPIITSCMLNCQHLCDFHAGWASPTARSF